VSSCLLLKNLVSLFALQNSSYLGISLQMQDFYRKKAVIFWGGGGHDTRQQYSELQFCFLYVGVQLGLSRLCFVTGCWGYFTIRRKQHEAGKSCIIMSFTICTHHQISLGWPNKERWEGLGTLNTRHRKAKHGFGLIIRINEALQQAPRHRLKGIITTELWPQDGAGLRLFTYFTLGTSGRLS
jgi:hypothetical protein